MHHNLSRLPAFLLLSIGLALPTGLAAQTKKVVQSTNYPLHYFAQRLAGASFQLDYIVDPEEDPAFWKPDTEAIAAFQKADIVLKNGADYEKWMERASLRRAPLVDTSKAFSSNFIQVEGKEHRHGDGTVHSHAGTAYTTWIDFSQAAQQAQAVAARFRQTDPADAAAIDERLSALMGELAELNGRMKAFGTAWGDKPLVASHPIYHYLARAYGLAIEPLEWEPDMEMEESDLADLKALLKKHPAKWMIWEEEPTPENVAAIAELGVGSVVFDPCANLPEEGDWLSMMQANVEAFENLLALPSDPQD